MPEKARRRKMQARLFMDAVPQFFSGGLHTCAMMECGTGSGKDGAQDMNEEAPYGYT